MPNPEFLQRLSLSSKKPIDDEPSFSPDGKQILFESTGGNGPNRRIYTPGDRLRAHRSLTLAARKHVAAGSLTN